MNNIKEYPHLRKVFLRMLLFRLFIPLMLVELLVGIGIVYLRKINLENHQTQVTESMAHIVENHIDDGGKLLEAVGRVAETSDKEGLSKYIASTCEAYTSFETIYCLDKENKISLMAPSNNTYTGMDMSYLPDFKVTTGRNNLIISRPFISLRTGEPIVYIIRPLIKGGCVIGELNLALFQQEIENIANKEGNDYTFIMDQAGTLIAHPSVSLVKEQFNMSDLKIFNDESIGKKNDMYLYDGKLVDGSAAKIDRTGWVVVDQVPISTFLRSYTWVFIITILSMLLIWMAMILNLRKQISRHIITPLEELTKNTNSIAIGDFSGDNCLSSISTSFDEIRKLMVNFEMMSSNLQYREKALMESESRNRGLVNRMRLGLFRANLDGQIQTINPMGTIILRSIDSIELIKGNVIDFLSLAVIDQEKKEFMIKNIYNLNNFEVEIKCCTGQIMWIEINSYIVETLYDQPEFFEGSIQDISERKQTEFKLKEQQELIFSSEKEKREALEKALVMKDEFISLISHEFKTPLNVIYSAIQLIECVYINKIPERVQQLIGNIKQNTFRQLRLSNNLLDVIKMNSGQIKLNIKNIDIVILTRMIAQSVEPYANQKNINVYFISEIENKLISIDEEKYERIILNILSNAMKFTESGGKIKVLLTEESNQDYIKIEISDTGIGIPKDKLDIIFERFGQVDSNLSRRAEGTGIGLSLVKLLVETLDGSIEVESELGVGSKFIITLPANKKISESQPETRLDVEDRLVSEIKVQFSDIYL